MAGTDASFDAGAFRDAIEFAMVMGTPQGAAERATFLFPATTTYYDTTGATPVEVVNPRTDQNGNPLNPDIRREQVRPASVQVPVAVEFNTANMDERPIGSFKATRASITVLDEHWPQVKDAVEVQLGGDTYVISYTHPPVGLFEVTIYTMECFARSET